TCPACMACSVVFAVACGLETSPVESIVLSVVNCTSIVTSSAMHAAIRTASMNVRSDRSDLGVCNIRPSLSCVPVGMVLPSRREVQRAGPEALPFLEDCLGNHPMDALGAVDHLRHVIVHRDAGDHVRLLAREVRETAGDEIDGFAHRDLQRLLE